MQVRCPECNTTFQTVFDATAPLVACPACMHDFEVAQKPKAAWLEPEVRSASGKRLGKMDRHLIRERLYCGELKGDEQVKAAGESWVPIASRPEFADAMELAGIDLGARRISSQALRGWRKTGSAIGAKRTRKADDLVAEASRQEQEDKKWWQVWKR